MTLRRSLAGWTFAGRSFRANTLRGNGLAVALAPTSITQRTAVNQGPGHGADYPFIGANAASGIFLDFYLSFEDPGCAIAWPLKLAWVAGFGTNEVSGPATFNVRDIRVVDANGTVIADTSAAQAVLSEVPWGYRHISQWVADDFVMRAVWLPTVANDFDTYLPFDVPLDPRTCDRLPLRLRSITADTATLRGDIVFRRDGYNTTVTAAETTSVEGGRVQTVWTLAAAAGSGIGAFPGCQGEAVPINRINGIAAANGLFTLEAHSCHRIGTPGLPTSESEAVAVTTENAWQFTNDCGPCRRCEEFAAVYRGARRVFDRWWRTGQQAEAVRDLYQDNRQRWLAQRECRRAKPAKLAVFPQPECRLAVSGLYCNMSTCCLFPVELRFTFRQMLSGTPVASTGAGYDAAINSANSEGDEAYTLDGTWPVLRAYFDGIAAQTTATTRFRTCGSCGDESSIEVTLSVHAVSPGVDEHGRSCLLETVDVPPEIQAIWSAQGLPSEPLPVALVQRTVPLDPSGLAFNCEECG